MNGDKRALELGLRYADHQWEDPTGEPGKKVGGNGNFPIERQGLLDDATYGPAARKAWVSLCGKLDEYANLAAACVAIMEGKSSVTPSPSGWPICLHP